MVTGLPPYRAYQVAEAVEERLLAGGLRSVTRAELDQLTIDVLTDLAGDRYATNFSRWNDVARLDVPTSSISPCWNWLPPRSRRSPCSRSIWHPTGAKTKPDYSSWGIPAILARSGIHRPCWRSCSDRRSAANESLPVW